MSVKRKSVVWEHFDLVEVDGRKKTKCKICEAELAYSGGTSSMQHHMNKHPGKIGPKELGTKTEPQQPTLKQMFGGTVGIKMSPARYQFLVRKIAEMCALDFRPLSIVNGEGFQSLVHALDPNFKIPSHTCVRNYVHKIYCETKDEILKMLKGQSVALTTDLWTSTATEGYITLTAHFIDETWALQSQVLATRKMLERHTGKNIAEEIKKLVEEFDLDVVAVTHDNAANMDVCLNILGYPHFGCAGHTLQLAVNDGLKVN